ncbi:MAG: hypothetical protein VB128_01675 [Sedimentibacter saalensis]|uniref:hypothetical protein n=1 Tax=Sedimentibacter saalensis TaxID=130788 RepID=UPI002B1E9D3D|nr:hypothetical protein [Sedimentibacter saalensis]MEA5093641.1 hypothetical protein [Sedimentibacter saalensis]
MMKKILSLVMVVVMVMGMCTTGFANELNTSSEIVQPRGYYEVWKVKSKTFLGTTYGSYKYLTTLGPADADGESFSVSQSVNVGVSINGPLYVSKSALGTALGFSVTGDIGVSITKNSRLLSKGEMIEVEYRLKNDTYNVTQVKEIHMDGQIIEGETATVTVFRPNAFADVRFTYYSIGGKAYLTQEFEALENGELVLVREVSL